MNKKIVSLFLAIVLSLGLAVPALAVYEKPSFTDVPRNAYYYTYVEEAVANGWIKGYGSGKFGPEDKVTYAQMCVMLTNAFFRDEYNAYTGAQSPWYVPYCNVADQAGLLEGTNIKNTPTNEAAVSQHVTRYEMAQMIYNAMKVANKKMPDKYEIFDARFATADWGNVPERYWDAVATAKAAGIINGIDSQGTFSGRGNMTRAQAAIVLVNLSKIETAPEALVEPAPVVPDKPVEITRSPFGFKDGYENAEAMMMRLNNEAPNYFEGYLSNGKPITEANITAMIEGAKVSMPDGTTWDTDDKYDYNNSLFGWSGGCNSFSGALSDYIFGKDAPVAKHQNFDQLKIGDVIRMQDSSTGAAHVVMVTGFGTSYTGDAYFTVGEGNASSHVSWDRKEYLFNWIYDSSRQSNWDRYATRRAESYIYSRY